MHDVADAEDSINRKRSTRPIGVSAEFFVEAMPMSRQLLALLCVSVGLTWAASAQDNCPQPTGCPAWAGIYPTVLLPWACPGQVDVPALMHQVNYHLAGGVQGLLVLGTIGEGEQADMAERAVVIQTVCSHVAGRVPVVVGIHTASAEKARAQMEQAQQLGAAAVLIKYLPRRGECVRFSEVYSFYRDLALAEVLPIFVYYFPSQTGVELTPAEVAQLLRLRGVVGIKNSILDLGHVRKQIELTQRSDVAFLSGTALNLTQFHAIGGHGAMCPEALLLPRPTVAAWQAAVEGRSAEARQRQKMLFAVAPLLTRPPVTARTARTFTMLSQDLGRRQEVGPEATPARLKYALNALGVPMSALVKPPLPPLGQMERLWVETQLPELRRVASQ